MKSANEKKRFGLSVDGYPHGDSSGGAVSAAAGWMGRKKRPPGLRERLHTSQPKPNRLFRGNIGGAGRPKDGGMGDTASGRPWMLDNLEYTRYSDEAFNGAEPRGQFETILTLNKRHCKVKMKK